MTIKVGNLNITSIYSGSTPIKEVYCGSELIWSATGGEIDFVFDSVAQTITNTIGTTERSGITYIMDEQISKGVPALFSGQTKSVSNKLYLVKDDTSGETSFIGSGISSGPTWISRNTSSSLQSSTHQAMTYGDGMFLYLSGEDYSVYYTTDNGVTWSHTLTLGDFSAITYGDGRFVIVGWSNNCYYSTNGVSWTKATTPAPNKFYYGIAYGDGRFVAAGYDGNVATYSTDGGVTWSQSTLPQSAQWSSIAYGNGKFVAINDRNTGAYSTDGGETWTSMTLPRDGYICITYGDGRFVAINPSGYAAYSTNGINWSEYRGLGQSGGYTCITYGGGKFVAIGYSHGYVAYSTDGGVTWVEKDNVLSNKGWTSITYGDGKFMTGHNYSFSGNTVAVGEFDKAIPPVGFDHYDDTGYIITLNSGLDTITNFAKG